VLVRVCNWKMTVGMRMLCHVYLSSNDRNLLFESRRESLKPGSISRLQASCQQLDSESDKEKAASIRHLGRRLSDKVILCQI
jgi:hypothetical protein